MPQDPKTEMLRKLTADLHKEIGQAEPIADEQLERNIERARALLRWLSEERELRLAKQALQTPRRLDVDIPLADKSGEKVPDETPAQMPKRDALVLALEKVGVASPPARVAAIVRAIYGSVISTSQFASFRKGDERSYRRAPRNRVYLVPALSAADLSAMAGMVSLSSWAIERRIIGGYSQRVDALRGILKAYSIYQDTKDTTRPRSSGSSLVNCPRSGNTLRTSTRWARRPPPIYRNWRCATRRNGALQRHASLIWTRRHRCSAEVRWSSLERRTHEDAG